jgi:hypothetical protein
MNKQGVTLYLHVHQPWRVRRYTVFDTASRHDYFLPDGLAEHDNQTIFKKVADKSYRPMNRLLEQLLNERKRMTNYDSRFPQLFQRVPSAPFAESFREHLEPIAVPAR